MRVNLTLSNGCVGLYLRRNLLLEQLLLSLRLVLRKSPLRGSCLISRLVYSDKLEFSHSVGSDDDRRRAK